MKKWICLNCDAENDSDCNFCPKCGFPNPSESITTTEERADDNSPESSLAFVAKIIYGICLVIAVTVGIAGVFALDYPLNISAFGVAIALAISAIAYSCFLKVICNISNSLKEINKKIKR